jgi:hypothetical protein
VILKQECVLPVAYMSNIWLRTIERFILGSRVVSHGMNISFQRFSSVILCILSVLSVVVLCQTMFVVSVSAQNEESIVIKIVNSSFAPLSTVEGNQVRVSVNYQVNDGSLEDEKINGIMKIYSENGTLVHSSSFPEGFIAKKKGGTEDFRTTIRDPTVTNLLANVTFIDFARQDTLSNTVTANLTMQGDNQTQSVSDELEPSGEDVFTEDVEPPEEVEEEE